MAKYNKRKINIAITKRKADLVQLEDTKILFKAVIRLPEFKYTYHIEKESVF